MNNITVIDYGLNNLLSVQRALEKCGANVTISSDPKFIVESTKVVFPGIGAYPDGMNALKDLNLDSAIKTYALSGKPLLAICLGMEMLFDQSNEFRVTRGLGLISGDVVPVPGKTVDNKKLKVPHIGWSELEPTASYPKWNGTILSDIKAQESAYFVHSYMAVPKLQENLLATVKYGGNQLAAVVIQENIIGCQFHPEKSGEVGLRILKKFCDD